MSVVKGSDQDDLIIVRRRSGYKLRMIAFVVGTIVFLGGGGYIFGGYHTAELLSTLKQQNARLSDELESSQVQVAELSQQVAVLETGGVVDRKAAESVKNTVKELNNQVADLKQEVSFYKNIMQPSNEDKGLRISKIEISKTNKADIYNYSIMLTQVSDNNSHIDGIAAVNITGIQDGQATMVPLRDLDESITELGIRFRFKYFQEIKGTVVLPDGFSAEQLQVVLQSSGRKQQKVEKVESWPV